MPNNLRKTAAWRIAIWTTLAFSIGTFIAFFIVYVFVAQEIRSRTDAWLTGESHVLAEVAKQTPRDDLYNRIVGEVAELASQEVTDEKNKRGERINSVFFLETSEKDQRQPIFVGPGVAEAFRGAIQRAQLRSGIPDSLQVEGWKTSFRVVSVRIGDRSVYLGLADRGGRRILHKLTRRFLWIWAGTVFLGFLISYTSTRRTLRRVEEITETVSQMGSDDLDERLPEVDGNDEISRLAATFNLMLGRIQSSVSQLHTVTESVAHDLKSPITSVRGTLESALFSNGGEKWRDEVGLAIEELDRVAAMLNNTLDVAEAQAGALRLNRQTVDLSKLVRQFAELYQPAMTERGQDLRVALVDDAVINADPKLLDRAVSNLLENELVHVPEGSQVEIRLRSDGNTAELVIEDDGPGFPAEVRSRAFERFVKGEESPGHGLGLAFVDVVVQAHGGTVSVGDRPSGGAVIKLSLPLVNDAVH